MEKVTEDFLGCKVEYTPEDQEQVDIRAKVLESNGEFPDLPHYGFKAGDRVIFNGYAYEPENEEEKAKLVFNPGQELILVSFTGEGESFEAYGLIGEELSKGSVFIDEIVTKASEGEELDLEILAEEKEEILKQQEEAKEEVKEETKEESVDEEPKETPKKTTSKKAKPKTTKKKSIPKTEQKEEESKEEETAESTEEVKPRKITPKKGRQKAINAKEKEEEKSKPKSKTKKATEKAKPGRKAKEEPSFLKDDMEQTEKDILKESNREQGKSKVIDFGDLDKADCKKVLKLINHYQRNLSAEIYEISRLLACVKFRQLYLELGYETFEDFCIKELDMRYQAVMGRIKAYTKCVEIGLTKDQFCLIGYTTIRDNYKYMTADNIQDIIEISENNKSSSSKDRAIRTKFEKVEDSEETYKATTEFKFILENDEGSFATQILEAVRQSEGDPEMSPSAAFSTLCAQWATFNNANTTIEDDVEYLISKHGLVDNRENIYNTFGIKDTTEERELEEISA
jgi:hypothetical protein